jgi:4'-phosphopantetheinyl transferase
VGAISQQRASEYFGHDLRDSGWPQTVSTDSNPVEWFPAPSGLELGEADLHLWRASLDCDASVLSRLQATLSPDEVARADRFVFPADRNRFVAARGILRELLGAYSRLPPAKLKFRYGNHGKPALDANTSDSALQFNLSHAGGLAIYAFSRGRELGVDVEQIRPQLAGDEIARRYFAPSEVAELQALPARLRPDAFFLCWTRKEAYVKAHGAGLSLPLDSFTVSLTPGPGVELQAADGARWSVESLEPGPGFAAAIVVERGGCKKSCWNWSP